MFSQFGLNDLDFLLQIIIMFQLLGTSLHHTLKIVTPLSGQNKYFWFSYGSSSYGDLCYGETMNLLPIMLPMLL